MERPWTFTILCGSDNICIPGNKSIEVPYILLNLASNNKVKSVSLFRGNSFNQVWMLSTAKRCRIALIIEKSFRLQFWIFNLQLKISIKSCSQNDNLKIKFPIVLLFYVCGWDNINIPEIEVPYILLNLVSENKVKSEDSTASIRFGCFRQLEQCRIEPRMMHSQSIEIWRIAAQQSILYKLPVLEFLVYLFKLITKELFISVVWTFDAIHWEKN